MHPPINFVVLSFPEAPILEEGEMQQFEEKDVETDVNSGPMDQAGASILDLPRVVEPMQQHHTYPNGANVSPSYVDITRKK